jgi:hypothetical protein
MYALGFVSQIDPDVGAAFSRYAIREKVGRRYT